MSQRLGQYVQIIAALAIALFVSALAPITALAAPYAAILMDARNGKILYSDNADTRLHPASLTKMMTLYITFTELRKGALTLDTPITVTAHAANQAPTRLGLHAGQVIALRYLIRAAAVKSANDAAAAIGDAIGGSEAGFAARMNRTAKALGMTESTFRNANGLTEAGHMSSAHDMAILGRHLFYDFPEYYNIFSRRETDAGVATVYSTNRKFLESYQGADGIKTGFTNPSGFNLVASAQRGNKRLIGVIFGETSTAARNAKMAKLLDMGFNEVADNVAVRKPTIPNLDLPPPVMVASAHAAPIQQVAAVSASLRPAARPDALPQTTVASIAPTTASIAPTTAVVETTTASLSVTPAPRPASLPQSATIADPEQPGTKAVAPTSVADNDGEAIDNTTTASTTRVENIVPTSSVQAPADSDAPKPRPDIVFASAKPADAAAPQTDAPEVISRMSTSGGRDWAILLGRYPSQDAADKMLLRVALTESTSLADTLRKVVQRKSGYDATFVGLSQDQADLACRRLQAREIQCFTMAP
ncbi:MAG: serine hydrolase [Paracoccaceae bacterium]|nr:serine hydrolase [Paracoccaceae bacterium]